MLYISIVLAKLMNIVQYVTFYVCIYFSAQLYRPSIQSHSKIQCLSYANYYHDDVTAMTTTIITENCINQCILCRTI